MDSVFLYDPVKLVEQKMLYKKNDDGNLFSIISKEDKSGKNILQNQSYLVVKIYKSGVVAIDTLAAEKMTKL
ncbi:hypothetical protein GCM10023313_06070 [Mucilaginibacter defluvii]|uniref:Uncharacterized protein n=1 Tax=Mucilaginibacter defluvii TaxID=1196019 RepID=A0ABP9FLC1_9SPHI